MGPAVAVARDVQLRHLYLLPAVGQRGEVCGGDSRGDLRAQLADDADRDAYAAEVAQLLDPTGDGLRANSSRNWGSSPDRAVDAIVAAIHAAVKETIGTAEITTNELS